MQSFMKRAPLQPLGTGTDRSGSALVLQPVGRIDLINYQQTVGANIRVCKKAEDEKRRLPQQDNDPKYISKSTMDDLQRDKLQVLPHTS